MGGEPDAPEDHVVELRHDAGLTAGHTLGLRPGKFRLGPRQSSDGGLGVGAPESVSFDLTIGSGGEVTLNADHESVAVEGVVVDRPVHLEHGDVIQLRTDHFVLRSLGETPRRRPISVISPRAVPAASLPTMSGWLLLFGAVAIFGLIFGFVRSSLFGLLLIGLGGIVGTLIVRSRRHDRIRHERTTKVSNARSLFFQEIIESRKAAAEVLRSEANTPATVALRASQSPVANGSRLYATVASGDRSWEPPVVCHRDPGWDHQAVVDELTFLPAIPFTIDLDVGPVAVVGPRLATLAVARHIATTALVATPLNTGVSVETVVPADWRWLPPTKTPTLRILDGVRDMPHGRTVMLASSMEALDAPFAFSYVIQIQADGRASIRQPDGQTGSGFAPHGITEKQARHIVAMIGRPDGAIDLQGQGAIDLQRTDHDILDTHRLLVTGPDRARNKNVLATAALRQAARFPDRSIFILDRGDRALIRLAQLEACRRYVAVDQIANVDFMMGELDAIEAESPGRRVLFLAPDLWEATAFYRNSGRSDLADRIDKIVSRMEVLPIAASAADLDRVPRSSFLVWVNTDGINLADVQVTNSSDCNKHSARAIDLNTLPGYDLTASIARLTMSLNEEIPT